MTKFKRAPVKNVEAVEAFIGAAEINQPIDQSASNVQSSPVYPWEGKRNDKQTEIFNLRLTEVELEKLRYIATYTPDSMQAFIRRILLPAIEQKLAEIIK